MTNPLAGCGPHILHTYLPLLYILYGVKTDIELANRGANAVNSPNFIHKKTNTRIAHWKKHHSRNYTIEQLFIHNDSIFISSIVRYITP